MPEQQQIFHGAVQAAPADYPVGASVELILKQVNAVFDGSSAAGSWLPAVVLLSDSGHVIGRYVNRAEPIAAGASAEVTWFPGVKASAGGATIAWGGVRQAVFSSPIAADTVNGNPTDIDFSGPGSSFAEDGSGVFFFDPAFPLWLQATIPATTGIFVIAADITHESAIPPQPDPPYIVVQPYLSQPPGPLTSLLVPGVVNGQAAGNLNDASSGWEWSQIAVAPSVGGGGPTGFGLQVSNFSPGGGALDLIVADLYAFFIGV